MSPIGRDDAAAKAAEELLKPGYQRESLVDLIWRRFTQFIGDLMDAAAGSGTTGGLVAAVVIVVILLAIAGLVIWRLRTISRQNSAVAGGLFGERAMSAAEHRREAERLATAGLWTEAIQERLRAIARDLEERALVDGMPGRTADELAAEAGRALPGFADELATAARSFDDVAYGGVQGTSLAYGSMRDLDERLRQARPVPLGASA